MEIRKKIMDFLIFFQYLSVMEWEVTAKESRFSSTLCAGSWDDRPVGHFVGFSLLTAPKNSYRNHVIHEVWMIFALDLAWNFIQCVMIHQKLATKS